jgi:hypothetical protein
VAAQFFGTPRPKFGDRSAVILGGCPAESKDAGAAIHIFQNRLLNRINKGVINIVRFQHDESLALHFLA